MYLGEVTVDFLVEPALRGAGRLLPWCLPGVRPTGFPLRATQRPPGPRWGPSRPLSLDARPSMLWCSDALLMLWRSNARQSMLGRLDRRLGQRCCGAGAGRQYCGARTLGSRCWGARTGARASDARTLGRVVDAVALRRLAFDDGAHQRALRPAMLERTVVDAVALRRAVDAVALGRLAVDAGAFRHALGPAMLGRLDVDAVVLGCSKLRCLGAQIIDARIFDV